MEPVTVQWAFIVAVDSYGEIVLVDHEFVTNVKAKRIATLDDIYSAAFIASGEYPNMWCNPGDTVYSFAFLVFQMPEGHIAASPNIFENFIVLSGPSANQVRGALGVLQGQIIAQRTADLAAQVAVQATLSVLKSSAAAADPDAKNKTKGGLIVA